MHRPPVVDAVVRLMQMSEEEAKELSPELQTLRVMLITTDKYKKDKDPNYVGLTGLCADVE